ncbi:MAG: UDP-N-acetylglucosamine 1-carboxyvinyltransferase [Patescibacteria group bacterium]
MSRLVIKGGKQLKGEWRLSGNKNEALALIAASLLFENKLVLKNIPKIKDVEIMTQIADYLKKHRTSSLPPELSSKIRGSLLFLGPLLATRGKATIPKTGGDKIGLRKIDTHLEVFKAFGAKISGDKITLPKNVYYNGKTTEIWLSEPSVTATENAMMLASARPTKTIIKNAASEPHVVNLGVVLKKGGARISGLGTNLIEVKGTKNFKRVEHTLSEDYMELGGVLVLSAIFGGKIKVKTGNNKEYRKIFETFEKFGKKVIQENVYLKVVNDLRKDPDLNKHIREISDGPWPNFPSDLMGSMIILATQCQGNFLFHEKMFESRLFFIDRLKTLGAKMILCDPHRVLVSGPSTLYGNYLVSPDIRAGMAMVIAALCAKGTSVIENAEQIDRGYENLIEKIKKVGGDIKHA